MNIILLKHGDKYSAADVNNQAQSLKKYTDHDIFCFTEDPKDVIIKTVAIPLKPKLSKWWNKMSLFRDDFPITGKCILFDLDVEIKSNPFTYVENIDWDYPTFMHDYWKKDLYHKKHAFDTELNSSVLAWTTGNHTKVWDLFSSNIDYHTRKYRGIDRFFWNEKLEWKTFDERIHESVII